MAHFASTGRIVISGTAPQGEVWSTGFWITGPGPTSQADAQSKIDTFANAGFAGPLDQFRAGLPTTGNINRIRLYWYVSASPVGATYIADATFAPAAGTGTGSLPEQTAIVATLRSGAAGRSGKGRMYLPCIARSLTAHQLDNTQVTNIANNVASLLNAGGLVAGAAGRPCVNAQVLGNPVPVLSVSVDSRTDVQRRRADKQQVNFNKVTVL